MLPLVEGDYAELRKRIQGQHLINEIGQIGDWAVVGWVPVCPEPVPGEPIPAPTHFREMLPGDIKRLDLALKCRTVLLDRILPSLKAVELQAEVTERPARGLTDLQLAARVACLIGQLPEGADAVLPTHVESLEAAPCWL
jgi:hypothetical protein